MAITWKNLGAIGGAEIRTASGKANDSITVPAGKWAVTVTNPDGSPLVKGVTTWSQVTTGPKTITLSSAGSFDWAAVLVKLD